MEKFEKHGL